MNTPEPFSEWQSSAPDDYSQLRSEFRLHDPDRTCMRWTGITPPGFPKFAVYKRRYVDDGLCYVYEGGYFWEAAAWRKFWRENGKTPNEVLHPATAPNEGQ